MATDTHTKKIQRHSLAHAHAHDCSCIIPELQYMQFYRLPAQHIQYRQTHYFFTALYSARVFVLNSVWPTVCNNMHNVHCAYCIMHFSQQTTDILAKPKERMNERKNERNG